MTLKLEFLAGDEITLRNVDYVSQVETWGLIKEPCLYVSYRQEESFGESINKSVIKVSLIKSYTLDNY